MTATDYNLREGEEERTKDEQERGREKRKESERQRSGLTVAISDEPRGIVHVPRCICAADIRSVRSGEEEEEEKARQKTPKRRRKQAAHRPLSTGL